VLERSALVLAVGATVASLTTSACVFPAQDPTGVELSWRFVELNENDLEMDDEDMQQFAPVRTCVGALVNRVDISITDLDDETRSGNFDYGCEDGFQTPDQARTEASDAFLELDPGAYAVEVQITDTMGRIEPQLMREVNVLSRTLTIEAFDLARPLTQWRVTLTGATDCNELRLRLLYADPENQLGEPPVDEDGEIVPTVYRENLVSDRGLSLGGAPSACNPWSTACTSSRMSTPGDTPSRSIETAKSARSAYSWTSKASPFPSTLRTCPARDKSGHCRRAHGVFRTASPPLRHGCPVGPGARRGRRGRHRDGRLRQRA
jgi:hypothetical protein